MLDKTLYFNNKIIIKILKTLHCLLSSCAKWKPKNNAPNGHFMYIKNNPTTKDE